MGLEGGKGRENIAVILKLQKILTKGKKKILTLSFNLKISYQTQSSYYVSYYS